MRTGDFVVQLELYWRTVAEESSLAAHSSLAAESALATWMFSGVAKGL